jgi:hypothetical protein
MEMELRGKAFLVDECFSVLGQETDTRRSEQTHALGRLHDVATTFGASVLILFHEDDLFTWGERLITPKSALDAWGIEFARHGFSFCCCL